jgi:aldehyde dehydrogenase (NAD+)
LAVATQYGNYIDGAWVTTERTVENRNPATGELIGTFAESSLDDADRAVAAARAAYPAWRLTPAPKRAELLFTVAELIRERKAELTRLMTQEMGKVTAEAGGDVQEGVDMTYFMAGEGRRQYGQVVPSELPDKAAMMTRQPMGVVARSRRGTSRSPSRPGSSCRRSSPATPACSSPRRRRRSWPPS